MHQVLIVDDSLGVRETFAAVLRLEGYEVLDADTGRRAIECLAAHSPTAMLVNHRLPDMMGLDVLRWMRSANRFVPTAIVTAFPLEFDPDEAIELGALAYPYQPLSIETLLAIVRDLVRRPSARDDPNVLHRRVLAGDPAALDALAEICLRELPSRLQRAFPHAPWDFAVDAATDANLEYGANPARFQPSRSALMDFVYLIARRNLQNLLRSESTRKDREAKYAAEHSLVSDPQSRQSDIELWASVVAVTINSSERRVAHLWLDEAGNDAIAEALGACHLTSEDRRQEAKRFKDRLLKRLSRHLNRPYRR